MTVALRGSAASLFAVVACLLALPDPAGAQGTEPPNIVLVVTDDQRWDTLWAMPTVTNELVRKGVRFTRAFAVNPLCCPARASILTGTYSHTNGVWSNSRPHGGLAVFDDRPTIATWLNRAGYETMLVGKYMNGYTSNNVPFTYVPPGWDRWLAFFGRHGYYHYALTDGVRVRRFGPEPVEEEYSTDVLGAEAVRFIRSASSPFFLYFAPFAPHKVGISAEPAPRHVDAYAGVPYSPRPSVNEADVSDKPRHIRRRDRLPVNGLTKLRETQLESLLAVDEVVARLLGELQGAGELRNTLFIFTSDNGHTWGERRWIGKSVPYEESIRVPLVARWDALGLRRRQESRVALNIDLASTITRAAGVRVRGRDGRSLLPLLPGGPVSWRSRFLLEYHNPPLFPSYCGTRSPRWKYVQYRTKEEELYHLTVDPDELRNLADKPQHRARVMEGRARVLRSACRPPTDYEPLPPCSLTGSGRADTIRGTRWRDWICAGGGRDTVRVTGGGRDVVHCGADRDTIYADRRDRPQGCERIIRQ